LVIFFFRNIIIMDLSNARDVMAQFVQTYYVTFDSNRENLVGIFVSTVET